MIRLLNVLGLILAGMLLSLAHPFRWEGFEVNPSWWTFLLSSLALIALLRLSSQALHSWSRFSYGFLGGFVYFLTSLYWIDIALQQFGNLPSLTSFLVAMLLAAYCALYFGIWSAIAGSAWILDRSPFTRCFLWACLWASLESLREYVITGFTWAEIGYSFSSWPWIGQFASVFGVHGLSFFWVFTLSCLIFARELIKERSSWRWSLGLLVSFFAIGFGSSYFLKSQESTRSLQVGIVQPNISQSMKWDAESASNNLQTLISLSDDLLSSKPELIVWPETSYPFLIAEFQRTVPFRSPVPSIIGAVVSNRMINYNSALLIQDDQILSRFDKLHLVPFGEYVPLENLLPFEKLVANVGRFVPGSGDQKVFKLAHDIQLGPLICYEDIFSRRSFDLVRKGANVLVNMTNDAWYGRSSAQRQHALIARMRVFETGVPMVRATNTGLSVSYDFEGNSEEIPMEKLGSLLTTVKVNENAKQSFFVLTFPLMQWIWLVIFAIVGLWKVKSPKKKIFFQRSRS